MTCIHTYGREYSYSISATDPDLKVHNVTLTCTRCGKVVEEITKVRETTEGHEVTEYNPPR